MSRALLAALPVAALLLTMPLMDEAQDPDTAPTVSCTVQTLPTRGLESTVARIICDVTGAPDGDTHFRVETDGPRPFCDADIVDGAGTCTGMLRDLASFMNGQLTLTVTLDPSGTQVAITPPN